MKAIKLIAAALTLLMATSFGTLAQEKKGEETVTFKTDIHCQNCVNKINKNIPFEKGVKDVKVNLENKEVTVTYDSKKTDKEKLVAAFGKIDVKAGEAKCSGTCAKSECTKDKATKEGCCKSGEAKAECTAKAEGTTPSCCSSKKE